MKARETNAATCVPRKDAERSLLWRSKQGHRGLLGAGCTSVVTQEDALHNILEPGVAGRKEVGSARSSAHSITSEYSKVAAPCQQKSMHLAYL